jgi:hypothetical protein
MTRCVVLFPTLRSTIRLTQARRPHSRKASRRQVDVTPSSELGGRLKFHATPSSELGGRLKFHATPSSELGVGRNSMSPQAPSLALAEIRCHPKLRAWRWPKFDVTQAPSLAFGRNSMLTQAPSLAFGRNSMLTQAPNMGVGRNSMSPHVPSLSRPRFRPAPSFELGQGWPTSPSFELAGRPWPSTHRRASASVQS